MKTTSIQVRTGAALVFSLAATAAQAHPGHGGLLSGLAHPWGGMDHLAAMVAVGLWAMTLQGHQRLAIPLTFLAAIVVGALLPMNQMLLPLAEQGIILSLLVMGGAIWMALRMPWQAAAVLMGLAGVCHGYAHAAEMPVGQSMQAFMAGMFVSTGLLHLVGIALAVVTSRAKPEFARYWGAPVALVGAFGLIG